MDYFEFFGPTYVRFNEGPSVFVSFSYARHVRPQSLGGRAVARIGDDLDVTRMNAYHMYVCMFICM